MGSSGEDYEFREPGQIPVSELNPEISNEVRQLNELRQKYQPIIDETMDPQKYAERLDMAGTRAETSAANRFAAMGIGGTSAGVGGVAEAGSEARRRIEEQRAMEALRASQAEVGISSAISGDIFGAQSQFSEYQRQLAEMMAAESAGDAGALGGLFQGIGTMVGGLGGALIGGPAGAIAGAGLGGGAGSMFSQTDNLAGTSFGENTSGYSGSYAGSRYKNWWDK